MSWTITTIIPNPAGGDDGLGRERALLMKVSILPLVISPGKIGHFWKQGSAKNQRENTLSCYYSPPHTHTHTYDPLPPPCFIGGRKYRQGPRCLRNTVVTDDDRDLADR